MFINNVKVIIIGSKNVGKTTMINRWSEDFFNPNHLPTVSVGIYNFDITIDGIDYAFHLWDTPGHESCRDATILSFHDARSAMIVYDTADRSTFFEVTQWIELLKSRTFNIPFVVVGNKCDLLTTEYKIHHYTELQELAKRYNCQAFFTSALDGTCIEESFQAFTSLAVNPIKCTTNASQIPDETSKSPSQQSNVVDLENSTKCMPGKCCK